jgi:hypothetical protein
MSERDGPTTSDSGESESEDDSVGNLGADGIGVSRRTMVVGAAGIGLGSIFGVGYTVLGDSTPGRSVEPTEPDDDDEATLSEFHYILENSGAENARLAVTEFRYYGSDDTVEISYRTRAPEVEDVPPQRQHVREVGQMTRMYAEYVAQNGDEADVVHAHIENPSEPANQPDGYLVRREWIEKFNSGEWSGNRTLNKVLGSGYTDEALENASTNNSTASMPTSASE